MSSSHNPSLSDIQRGILTEIGISQWKLEDTDRIVVEQSLLAQSAAESEAESPAEQISEVETAGTPDVVVESPVKNSTQDVEMISRPDKVLFAFSESSLPVWFTQDLLRALELEENTLEYVDSQRIQQYQDHALLCLSGDQLAYDGKQLTLPVEAEELSPVFKKELWEALIQYHGN